MITFKSLKILNFKIIPYSLFHLYVTSRGSRVNKNTIKSKIKGKI